MAEPSPTLDRPWPARLARRPLEILRNLFRVLPAAIEGFFHDRLGQHAAGIAYRVLFSLAPLAIILVWIVGRSLPYGSMKAHASTPVVVTAPDLNRRYCRP